jgi:hypothetical protein
MGILEKKVVLFVSADSARSGGKPDRSAALSDSNPAVVFGNAAKEARPRLRYLLSREPINDRWNLARPASNVPRGC